MTIRVSEISRFLNGILILNINIYGPEHKIVVLIEYAIMRPNKKNTCV